MANHSLNLLCTLKEQKSHTTQFWLSNNIRAELSCNLPLGAALKSEQLLNPFTYPLQDDTFSCCDSTGLLAARKSSNLITCPIIVGVTYHFFLFLIQARTHPTLLLDMRSNEETSLLQSRVTIPKQKTIQLHLHGMFDLHMSV